MIRHKAKFEGKVLYKRYRFGAAPYWHFDHGAIEMLEIYKPFVETKHCRLLEKGVYAFVDRSTGKQKMFFEGEIDGEPINVGEKIYIKGINDVVVIKDRYRNLNNEWTYETDYIIKIIEDEETVISREWAVKQYEEALMDIEHENVDDDRSNMSWWKKLFN
ncbi:hypothetical protein CHCC20441_3901 [Bacillus licheniformis]|uniref:hypothetical protein n=1 Tax=Bacillus TaxID=1386 RepID=UPI0009B7CA0A|nr:MULTISPECIES: hypothetical protein [Bacillus]MEC0682325.1 hypothetical protein [Bacillus haynesii]ARC58825.1 hypothetical protein BaDB11_00156 [Bacillus licheniformis]MDE1425535.1 hypothetical protein [Bacillus licheniformis]MEC2046370.1 hypothetical protein [Bacillus licheniformis]MED4326032.1 hypothetical protein [Bacillus licheniformis]